MLGELAVIERPDGAELRLPLARATSVDVAAHEPVTAYGAAAGFAATLALTPVLTDPARREATLTIAAREAGEAAVTVALTLGETDDPGWLIPGLFYGENRPPDCRHLFPRYATAPGADRLVSAHWSFRADRAATPAVFAWDRSGGGALACDERSPLGVTGLGLAMTDGRPTLLLHFPYRERPVRYTGAEAMPPVATHHRFAAGESVTLRFTVYHLPRGRERFTTVLRHRHAATAAAPPSAVAWVSISEAADLAAAGLVRWHHRTDPPRLIETAAFDRELTGGRLDRDAMHVGWLSGVPSAAALLAHARRHRDADRAAIAAAVIDTICANRTPSGSLWGQWSADTGWGGGWTGDPNRLHARTLAEAVTFLARAARAEREHGAPRPAWERAAAATLDMAVASQQRASGRIAAAFDARDGSAWDHRTCAGLAFVPALTEAAALLERPAYLAAAQAAGHAYAEALRALYVNGAPEDVDSAPTSEDGYNAVMAYVALARHDPGGPWLELAERAADLMLSFRYTYDVLFDPATLLGRYAFRTRGADQASPANQHLHSYGLICLPEMVWLASHTGDRYYRDSTAENLACFRQLVARRDGDFGARRGMVSERYHQTDCFAPKGMLLGLSHAWCLGLLLSACEAVTALASPTPSECAVLPWPC